MAFFVEPTRGIANKCTYVSFTSDFFITLKRVVIRIRHIYRLKSSNNQSQNILTCDRGVAPLQMDTMSHGKRPISKGSGDCPPDSLRDIPIGLIPAPMANAGRHRQEKKRIHVRFP